MAGDVSVIDDFIPLEDGTRLAVRLWLPPLADGPFGAVFEYVPYRKNDHMVPDDELNHGSLSSRGFACVRVDVRGTGDSEGLFVDEYSEQELADGEEIIAWIANQHWCNGSVAMMGISWGGINSLMMAARRPKALKAIVSACSTDDRFDNDVHFLGGAISGDWASVYPTMLLTLNARPPDPLVSGDAWRDIWLDRLRSLEPPINTWLAHQTRDDYWLRGSVCESLDAVECAIYMVGGWADRYVDTVMRMLEGYDGPKRGLIGPWLHSWPHTGVPGPAIDFIDDLDRFLRHWLLGEDNGADSDPELTVYMQESVRPATGYDHRPGRWITFDHWPPATFDKARFSLMRGGMVAGDGDGGDGSDLDVPYSLMVGASGGDSTGFLNPDADFPADQRTADSLSLTFTSEPFDVPIEIVGRPRVEALVSANATNADVCVRLCDVHPDGASTVISRGFLNLAFRDSRDVAQPLVPGESYEVTIRLKSVAYQIPAGHRLRVSVSPTYWPWVWPSPTPVRMKVSEGAVLLLPLCPPDAEPKQWPLPPPRVNRAFEPLDTPPPRRFVSWDANSDELVTTRDYSVGGTFRVVASDLTIAHRFHDEYKVLLDYPTSARVDCTHSATLERPGWRTHVEIGSSLTADEVEFTMTTSLTAYEGDEVIFANEWHETVPRALR